MSGCRAVLDLFSFFFLQAGGDVVVGLCRSTDKRNVVRDGTHEKW